MEDREFDKFAGEMKKQMLFTKITAICSAGLLVCVLVLTIAVLRLTPAISETASKINEIAEEALVIVDDVQELTKTAAVSIGEINKVVKQIDDALPAFISASDDISSIAASLNEEGLPKLYEDLDKLSRLDIESLNNSIRSLYDVIEPLAQLFRR